MHKNIITFILFFNILFASNVKITKSDVSFTLNGENREYKVNSTFKVKSGDILCNIKGSGYLEIDNNKSTTKIFSNTSPCHIVFIGDDDDDDGEENTNIPSGIKPIIVRGKNIGEFRGENKEIGVKKIVKLTNKEKFILISNKKWSPLPITLEIVDNKNRLVKEYVNSNETTQFLIPSKLLKDGYIVKVKNRVSKVLLEITIKKIKKWD